MCADEFHGILLYLRVSAFICGYSLYTSAVRIFAENGSCGCHWMCRRVSAWSAGLGGLDASIGENGFTTYHAAPNRRHVVPQIRPFAGIHFSKTMGPDISRLIAPPFDVLDEKSKAALQAGD